MREAGDLAKLGRHTDLGDDDASVALGDRGAGEDEVGGLGVSEVGLENGVRGLPHGVRLARERRLVDLEVRRAHDAAVRGDLVALGKDHDVTGDEVLREDLGLLAVADDVDVGRKHLLQGLGSLVCLVLLPEAEATVDEVDQPDGDAKLGHAGHEGDDAGHPEEDGHKVREVGEERNDRRLLLTRLDKVLAVLSLQFAHLVTREAGLARA